MTCRVPPTTVQGGTRSAALGQWLSRRNRHAEILSRCRDPQSESAFDGAELTVIAEVTYNISGAGPDASYPVQAQGHSDLFRLADCGRPHLHRQCARDA
jgi:hypothetical protein